MKPTGRAVDRPPASRGTDVLAPPENYWKALLYFNVYRLCIAGLLLVSSLFQPFASTLFSPGRGHSTGVLTVAYLLATLSSLLAVRFCRRRYNAQLTAAVLVDVLVLTLLMHASGGTLYGGLGAMMLITLAGAGLVGQGRLVLFYAAVATLAVLLGNVQRALLSDVDVADSFQAGLLCAGFFAIAISARLLARWVLAKEEQVRQRGEDLRNQTLLSQRVIEETQDGVLVLGREGAIRHHNPRARQLLGLGDPSGRHLTDYSTELSQGFSEWCERATDKPILVRAPASSMQLRARFVATESSRHDVLVFLEDMGRLQEQARQFKLAALGRLTASIAHEIRNPLSAIRHAGELLREDDFGPVADRLLRIVLDNAQRVERIVSDVLELGRRDRVHPERIDLRQTLPALVEEAMLKADVASGIVGCEFAGAATLFFDRSHLHQVLWNLLGNALRHSQGKTGSIRLRAQDAGSAAGGVELHVIDDGPGIDEDSREQIFEPFFTTHSGGTGLGLYIARELCEANNAHLDLAESARGADFCITGRAVEWQ